VSYLDNVNGASTSFPRQQGLDAPTRRAAKGSAVAIRAADPLSNHAYLTAESFLEPTALWEVDAADDAAVPIKTLPARFDASKSGRAAFRHSADGTRIHYFLVRPKAMRFDGSTPGQMFGYAAPDLRNPAIAEMGSCGWSPGRLCPHQHPRRRVRPGCTRPLCASIVSALRRLRRRRPRPYRAQGHLAPASGYLWTLERRRAHQRRITSTPSSTTPR